MYAHTAYFQTIKLENYTSPNKDQGRDTTYAKINKLKTKFLSLKKKKSLILVDNCQNITWLAMMQCICTSCCARHNDRTVNILSMVKIQQFDGTFSKANSITTSNQKSTVNYRPIQIILLAVAE